MTTPTTSTAVDLIAQYATADDSTRSAILEQLKIVDLPSLAPLMKLLSPSLKLDPIARWQAIEVLQQRYSVGPEAFQQAIQRTTIQGKIQQSALEACKYWQHQGASGLESLLAAVDGSNNSLRQPALLTLRNIRELSPETLDSLEKNLQKLPHSMDLALLLGKHGRVPAEAVPGLIAGLNTKRTASCMYCVSGSQRDESQAAEIALAKIDSAAATAAAPQLFAALATSNDNPPPPNNMAIGKIEGPAAAAAIPQLIEALKVENRSVRAAAAEALGNIGPPAKEAIPALIAARDCKTVLPAPRNSFAFIGVPSPTTLAIPAEATWALARIQLPEETKDNPTATQVTPEETDPELLTKSLPGTWKIEIAIAPKLLQRPIQEIRDYLYLIVTVQGGFQTQACQTKIRADGLAMIQLPDLSNKVNPPERQELPVNWKIVKNTAGKTTLLVNHPGVGDLVFRGSIRLLDADRVECEILVPLPNDKPEEPSLPILVIKLQRVKS